MRHKQRVKRLVSSLNWRYTYSHTMRRVITTSLCVVALAAAIAAANAATLRSATPGTAARELQSGSACDFPCTFDANVGGTPFHYDFSSACTAHDRTYQDEVGHTYDVRCAAQAMRRATGPGAHGYRASVLQRYHVQGRVCAPKQHPLPPLLSVAARLKPDASHFTCC